MTEFMNACHHYYISLDIFPPVLKSVKTKLLNIHSDIQSRKMLIQPVKDWVNYILIH